MEWSVTLVGWLWESASCWLLTSYRNVLTWTSWALSDSYRHSFLLSENQRVFIVMETFVFGWYSLNGPLTTNDIERSSYNKWLFFIYPRIHFLSCERRHYISNHSAEEERKSKWVWYENTTITHCRPTHGIMSKSQNTTCADPESFARVGQTLTAFILWGERGSK